VAGLRFQRENSLFCFGPGPLAPSTMVEAFGLSGPLKIDTNSVFARPALGVTYGKSKMRRNLEHSAKINSLKLDKVELRYVVPKMSNLHGKHDRAYRACFKCGKRLHFNHK
jgi:hypothetical protein